MDGLVMLIRKISSKLKINPTAVIIEKFIFLVERWSVENF